jgi:hypothetical protein
MNRLALLIYCDNTESGELVGPPHDNLNYRQFLKSNLGGAWHEDEIISLRNPSSADVAYYIYSSFEGIDYAFTLFSGHGFINVDHNNLQYIELKDKDVSILNLRNKCPKQTLIVDACRGYFSPLKKALENLLLDSYRGFSGDSFSTRNIFDDAVMRADQGWTTLYAASENQTALDTSNGGAYLLSLIGASNVWKRVNADSNILQINSAHEIAKIYLSENFATTQKPTMSQEKRIRHFPFAVKNIE